MKLLIILDSGFDTYGPSLHLYNALIEDLLLSGIEVHLIESHSTGNMPDAPQSLAKYKNFSFETIKKSVVPKKKFAKRYFSGVSYSLRVNKALKKHRNSFDAVMMQSCPWAPIMATIIKKRINAPLLWNIQDMFPGSSIANGVMTNKLMQKIFFKLHKVAYKKADYITVISDDMKEKVIQQGVPKEKITVIVNWFDDQSVHEVEKSNNKFIDKYNLKKDLFYVQFAGTMGFNFDYKFVLSVAKLLIDYKKICFQMIGFGSQKGIFEFEAKKMGLTNISFYPLQSQDMVSDVYSACDVCIIPLPSGVIGNSVPSKAGLLMACKRPIITSSDVGSAYNEMINNNKIGFAFGSDEYEKASDAILQLFKNPSLCKEMGLNGYKYGHELYSRKCNTRKYIELFSSIYENSSKCLK